MRFGKPLRGAMHPLARLSADQAALMREQLNMGKSLRAIGRDFGVSHEEVRKVRDRLAHDDKNY